MQKRPYAACQRAILDRRATCVLADTLADARANACLPFAEPGAEMSHSSARTQTIRSVRLSDDEVTAILDRLDEVDARAAGSVG